MLHNLESTNHRQLLSKLHVVTAWGWLYGVECTHCNCRRARRRVEQTTSARFALPQPSFLLSNALHLPASPLWSRKASTLPQPSPSSPFTNASAMHWLFSIQPAPSVNVYSTCHGYICTAILGLYTSTPWYLKLESLAQCFFLPTAANPHYCRSFHPLNCPASKSSFIGFGQKLQSISKVGQ